ncbi:MAG TPA: peptidase M56 [Clostridiaceae bacterium]|nr:peptidase M56 [Clostridiaceae bacterium]
MEAVFLKLVNLSLTASVMVLAVILVRLLFRKAPKWLFCLLWGLVALRLILPFSIESAFSLIPCAEPLPQEILYSANPQIQSGISAVGQVINSLPWESMAPAVGVSVTPTKFWLFLLSWVWLAVAAAMLLYTLISSLLLKRKLADATLYQKGIKQSELVDSPFVLGILHPVIYLPYKLNDADLAYIIVHEQAHIKRLDHWWKPLGFLLLSVYWFNPLLWAAYILLCRDIEAACDEKVVREMDREALRAYSTALLNCSTYHRRIAASPLAFGEVGVKERVKHVMNYRKPAFWIIIAAVVTLIVVAVCFLTNPKDSDSIRIDPFGKYYKVRDIIYESGAYAFSYITETAPKYFVTNKKELLVLEDKGSTNWVNAGTFEEIRLTKDNFDRYFWGVREPASSLRSNNQKAWCLLVTDLSDTVFYYLLLQKNGDVYLTYGYYDASEKDDPGSDDTSIRWVFSLIEDDSIKSTATKWFDGLHGDEIIWGDVREINLDVFPDVTFRCHAEKLEAVTDKEIVTLYAGMPIWNVYFCDLTGDGKPELCSTISIGSGIIDNRIIIYDYARGAIYELSDRINYDYVLNMKNGKLIAEKRKFMQEELVSSGELVFQDGTIQIQPGETD